jgi:hypothetical protein
MAPRENIEGLTLLKSATARRFCVRDRATMSWQQYSAGASGRGCGGEGYSPLLSVEPLALPEASIE